jgi:hypothetical protein
MIKKDLELLVKMRKISILILINQKVETNLRQRDKYPNKMFKKKKRKKITMKKKKKKENLNMKKKMATKNFDI